MVFFDHFLPFAGEETLCFVSIELVLTIDFDLYNLFYDPYLLFVADGLLLL